MVRWTRLEWIAPRPWPGASRAQHPANMRLQQRKYGRIEQRYQTLLRLAFTASENPSQSVELLLGEKSSAVLLFGLGDFTAVFIRPY